MFSFYLFVQGWPSSNNTWEIATSLSCPDILKKYQSKQKNELQSPKTPTSAKSDKPKAGKKSKTPTKKSKTTNKKSKSPSKSAKASKASKSKKKIEEDEDNDADDQDWEVEKIIDVRYNDDGTKEFQIRWKGCDSSQDTWEPEDNVNSPDLINQFMNKTDDTDDVVPPKKKSRKA